VRDDAAGGGSRNRSLDGRDHRSVVGDVVNEIGEFGRFPAYDCQDQREEHPAKKSPVNVAVGPVMYSLASLRLRALFPANRDEENCFRYEMHRQT
jgi:hypothetical protein